MPPSQAAHRSSLAFFDELVEQLRHVRLGAVPDVVASLQRASQGGTGGPTIGSTAALPKVATGARADQLLSQFAQAVVALEVDGSKLEAVERAIVLHAIATSGGNLSAAARLLGIDRKTYTRRLQKARRAMARAAKGT